MTIAATPRKPDKLAAQLTWLANRDLLARSMIAAMAAFHPVWPADAPQWEQHFRAGH